MNPLLKKLIVFEMALMPMQSFEDEQQLMIS